MIQSNQRQPRQPRGFAMIMVMIAVGMVFVISMSLLDGTPSRVNATQQAAEVETATSLADAGIAEALHRFNNPPEDDEDGIWDGVTGRSIPGLAGTYDVDVTQLANGNYMVTTTGHVTDAQGEVTSHSVAVEMAAGSSTLGQYDMEHVAVFNDSAQLHDDMEFKGEVLAEGGIGVSGVGVTEGNDVRLNVEVPDLDFDDYASYSYNGTKGTALVIDYTEFNDMGPVINPVTASNPLGVVIVEGDLLMTSTVDFIGGILLVDGDLLLNKQRLTVTAPAVDEVFFCLLVDDDIVFNATDSYLTVNDGTVYVDGTLVRSDYVHTCRFIANSGILINEGINSDFISVELEVDFPDVRHGIEVNYITSEESDESGGYQPVRYILNP